MVFCGIFVIYCIYNQKLQNMKSLIVFLPFLFLSFNLKNKSQVRYDCSLIKEKEIPYLKNKKLDWNCFNKRQKSNQIAAITESGISYFVDIDDGIVKVSVVCFFSKNGSYFTDGNNKPNILNHEQRHFDLSYIYTLEFMRRLESENSLNLDRIDYIYNEVANELDVIQRKYDFETKNSRDTEIQNRWDNIIENKLQKI